jgi:hypothetical protein
MTLDQFLETMAATPFVDGQSDCALTIADWVMAATGCPDPAHDLRGEYSSALGRERLLMRRGGLKAVMQVCADRAGLAATRTPRRGDIGLVVMNGQRLAAICLGKQWAAKGAGLVVGAPSRVVKAWRV